jgi:hypothetical protein
LGDDTTYLFYKSLRFDNNVVVHFSTWTANLLSKKQGNRMTDNFWTPIRVVLTVTYLAAFVALALVY